MHMSLAKKKFKNFFFFFFFFFFGRGLRGHILTSESGSGAQSAD